ncbi:MAG: hypothetical protein GWP14_00805 [Actinobacteria bacterium]|nr:hypothetical protein [Actinomycetota bacterium]
MKNEPFDEDIFRAAAETIEVLALMFLVPPEESLQDPQPSKTAHVDFTGPCGGSLAVSISESLLPELAANMLGEEDPDQCSIAQQTDALNELTNVICGNILPIVGGPEVIFHVGTPSMLATDSGPDDRQSRPPAGRAELFLDQGLLQVELYIKENSVV